MKFKKTEIFRVVAIRMEISGFEWLRVWVVDRWWNPCHELRHLVMFMAANVTDFGSMTLALICVQFMNQTRQSKSSSESNFSHPAIFIHVFVLQSHRTHWSHRRSQVATTLNVAAWIFELRGKTSLAKSSTHTHVYRRTNAPQSKNPSAFLRFHRSVGRVAYFFPFSLCVGSQIVWSSWG